MRTVKTASGATAVQIVHSHAARVAARSSTSGRRTTRRELEVLKAAARQRLAAGQGELDLGAGRRRRPAVGGPLPITSSRMGHLWDALCRAYDALGFDAAAGGDEVFRQLVLARIIEPTSKLDSLRVLDEVGVDAAVVRDAEAAPAGATPTEPWRQRLAAACAAHAGAGAGVAGALRRVHAVLRDRRR